MDEKSNRNQHETLFIKTDDHEKRLTALEIRFDALKKAHGTLKTSHKAHGKKISKHSLWIGTVAAGAALVLYILEKVGFWDLIK